MKERQQVILITGYKRSGKDASYDKIYKILSKTMVVERIGIADTMKQILADTLVISTDRVEDLKEATDREVIKTEGSFGLLNPLNMRQLLQFFGQAMKKVTDMYFWVRLAVNKVHQSNADVIVITDVRFPFESSYLKDHVGDVVTIKIDRGLKQEDTHESEIYIDDIPVDYVVPNLGDLEDLEENLYSVLVKEKII